MNKEEAKVKLRLLTQHYLNGQKKLKGSVIRLSQPAAQVLVDRKVATVLSR